MKLSRRMAIAAAVLSLSYGSVALSAKTVKLTGTVGDAMCGVKHAIADAAACTHGCVGKGADYALIVKSKAYTLKANDQIKAELDKLAGKAASVTGDRNGDVIQVTSVRAAK